MIRLSPLVRGSLIGILIMFGVFILTWVCLQFVFGQPNKLGVSAGYVLFEIIVAPIVAGCFAGRYWQRSQIPTKKQTGAGCISVLVTLLLIAIFTIEGYICLVIISPLIWAFFLLGVTISVAFSKRRDSDLKVSLVGIVVMIAFIDLLSSHHYESAVSDTIVINASADRVWKYVDSYPPITEKQSFWLFQIGLPRPVATTVPAHQQNATRKCIFSNGVVFDE